MQIVLNILPAKIPNIGRNGYPFLMQMAKFPVLLNSYPVGGRLIIDGVGNRYVGIKKQTPESCFARLPLSHDDYFRFIEGLLAVLALLSVKIPYPVVIVLEAFRQRILMYTKIKILLFEHKRGEKRDVPYFIAVDEKILQKREMVFLQGYFPELIFTQIYQFQFWEFALKEDFFQATII